MRQVFALDEGNRTPLDLVVEALQKEIDSLKILIRTKNPHLAAEENIVLDVEVQREARLAAAAATEAAGKKAASGGTRTSPSSRTTSLQTSTRHSVDKNIIDDYAAKLTQEDVFRARTRRTAKNKMYQIFEQEWGENEWGRVQWNLRTLLVLLLGHGAKLSRGTKISREAYRELCWCDAVVKIDNG